MPTPIEILRAKLKSAKGAGDVVAMVAQPIARAVDQVAGTNVAGCGGCRKRREILNDLIPFPQKPVDEGSQDKGTHETNH